MVRDHGNQNIRHLNRVECQSISSLWTRNRRKDIELSFLCVDFVDPYSDFGVNDPFTGDDDNCFTPPAVSYPDIVI